ncbi:Contactin-5 [Bulinus truncatus]|nr:Contactin-5 [Bulinus truncatus]
MNLYNFHYLVCAYLLVTCVTSQNNKKDKKKDKKKNLEWKQNSMAAMKKKTFSANSGDTVTFDCSASGNPQPSVTWYKNGMKLTNSNFVSMEAKKLTLNNVTLEMGGNYSCVVSNKHKPLTWSIDLNVTVKAWPLHIEGPYNITQPVGSNVSFMCKVTNDPIATIKWQKVKKTEDDEDIDFPADSSNPEVLSLINIKKSDEGFYRCRGINVWGSKGSSAFLTVIEPIIIPTTTPRVEYERYATMREESGLKNKDPYTDEDGGNLYDFGQVYGTTKRTRNRNKDKKDRKKDKKKDKKENEKKTKDEDDEDYERYFATTMATTSSITPEIWTDFDSNSIDTRSDSRQSNLDENYRDATITTTTVPKAGSASSSHQGSISSWTIYTIVGAVGGVVLLIGLIAITLTVCCQRDEAGIYKSTPV